MFASNSFERGLKRFPSLIYNINKIHLSPLKGCNYRVSHNLLISDGDDKNINKNVKWNSIKVLNRGLHLKPRKTNLESMNGLLESNRRGQTTWAETVIDKAPHKIQPYLKLMRLDKPFGFWLFFWPCTWSIAMTAEAGHLPDIKMLALFGAVSIIVRGAGCTINDICDMDIDSQVKRTKTRPLASGEVTRTKALAFFFGQMSIVLLMLTQINWYTFKLFCFSSLFGVSYPLMKRITYWPQFVLGLANNCGVFLGWSAINGSCDLSVCLPLYASGICWTIVYDTIYAHQDKDDDLLAGVKSTALKFGDNTKLYLSMFTTGVVGGFAYTGMVTSQPWPYYAALAILTGHMSNQLYTLDINNPSDCAKKFSSSHYVGLILFLGIVFSNLIKSNDNKEEDNENEYKVLEIKD